MDSIFNGQDLTFVENRIDTNVTDLESAKDILKELAGAVIELRKNQSVVAKILMWLRNVVIRTR